jgi:hypothetical protein
LTSQLGAGTAILFSVPYTKVESPLAYRKKAVTWGVCLLIAIPPIIWMKSAGLAAAALVSIIGIVRYWVAYRRARAVR